MIYPVVKYGQKVLEIPAAVVAEFNSNLEKLVADMFETMYAANGVGLAAPQIGISRRLCVIDVTSGENPEGKLVLANPVILATEGKEVLDEGCLSLPEFRAATARPRRVTVRAQNLHGKEFTMTGEGLLARAFCHETDHLNGMLFIQHLSMLKRDSIKRRVRKLMKAGEW
ncbi:MAG: peptide deformylase [Acidobacteria bacterium]|nr:peptide deformylase [Acidobacteriota bacterium]